MVSTFAFKRVQLVRCAEGYLLDPSNGLYYSAAAGMWYSGDNGGFTDGQGNWWYFDGASGQFVAWTRF